MESKIMWDCRSFQTGLGHPGHWAMWGLVQLTIWALAHQPLLLLIKPLLILFCATAEPLIASMPHKTLKPNYSPMWGTSSASNSRVAAAVAVAGQTSRPAARLNPLEVWECASPPMHGQCTGPVECIFMLVMHLENMLDNIDFQLLSMQKVHWT